MSPKPQLLIFDLDGTLVDSCRDLATAVNLMRRSYGLPPLSVETVTGFVGDGVRLLVTRAVQGTTIDIDEAMRVQAPLYREHLLDETALYPGVWEGLHRLRELGHLLAVGTNKPADACERILQHFKIRPLFAQVMGGGSTPHLKPHPEMLQVMMKVTGFAPGDTWMIGDNHTDLESGRRAGAHCVFLSYGYGHQGTEKPDLTIPSFHDVVGLFEQASLPG
jgi:phosphoglycolate phosphatase